MRLLYKVRASPLPVRRSRVRRRRRGSAGPGDGAAVRRYQRRSPTCLPDREPVQRRPPRPGGRQRRPGVARTSATRARRTCSATGRSGGPCAAATLRRTTPTRCAFAAAGLAPTRSAGLFAAMELEPWGGRRDPARAHDARSRRGPARGCCAPPGPICLPCTAPSPDRARPLADLLDGVVVDASCLRDARRAGRAPPDVAAAGRRGRRRLARRIAAPDRRRSPSVHDRPRVPGRAARPARSGPWDRVLTLVVDAATEHLPVLPFHRVQSAGHAAGDRRSGLPPGGRARRRCPTTT